MFDIITFLGGVLLTAIVVGVVCLILCTYEIFK